MYIFPEEIVIRMQLLNNSLNMEYLQKNGIDVTVSDLFAKRFAHDTVDDDAISQAVMLVLYDIKNGFTGRALPKYDLQDKFGPNLQISLEVDLKKCAKTA